MLVPLQALGTCWNIEFLEDDVDVSNIQKETQIFLECFESRYSRFRNESWLSILNQEKVFHNPDPEFVTLLNESLHYFKTTNGVFNIAVGEKMEKSGYDANYSFTKTTTQDSDIPSLPSVLSVTEEKITLATGRLDLGGIGKGFVIDSLVALYKTTFGLHSFIINGGGDIFATHEKGRPITVALTHPTDQTLSIGSINLCNQGFAASSPFVRAWKDKNTKQEYNHLHTSNAVASYVVADTACSADVWATTLAIDPAQTPKNVQKLLLQDSKILYAHSVFTLHTNT